VDCGTILLKQYFSHHLPDSLQICSQKCFQHSATALRIHENGLVFFSQRNNTLSHLTVAAHAFAEMELGRESSRGKVDGLTTKHWYQNMCLNIDNT
jgi:hypothetical protein